MKARHKSYLGLVLAAVLFFLIYAIGSTIPETTIRGLVTGAGPFAPAVLIFFIWLTYFFSPLSDKPFLFAGFYLFGPAVVVFSYLAASFAAVTNFLVARKWGEPIVERFVEKDDLKKLDKLADSYGLGTLFVTRFFMSQFYDVISYLAGLVRMRFWPYLIISLLAPIPRTILWYYLSKQINGPVSFTAFTFVFDYIPIVAYFLWKRFSQK